MHRGRILVVDDERNAREALRELLCDVGYEVALAADGEEAVRLLDTFHPDVVLTDVRMPKMGGFELAAVARRCPCAPRVAFMSVYQPPAGGHEPWLAKPLDLERLLGTVDSLMAA